MTVQAKSQPKEHKTQIPRCVIKTLQTAKAKIPLSLSTHIGWVSLLYTLHPHDVMLKMHGTADNNLSPARTGTEALARLSWVWPHEWGKKAIVWVSSRWRWPCCSSGCRCCGEAHGAAAAALKSHAHTISYTWGGGALKFGGSVHSYSILLSMNTTLL